MNQAGRLGMVAGKRLPYDAEVEYLKSTGTQWIDTGVILSSTDKVICNCRIISAEATARYVFGAFGDNANFGFNLGSASILNGIWGGSASGRTYGTYNRDYIVSLGHDGFYVDNVLQYTVQESFTGKRSCYLFWANGTSQLRKAVRIYFGKLYKDDVLVRDFIPVRFTNELGNSEGAMYDRANPTVGMNPDGSARTDGLYRNRGTGAFLYGNDI